MKRLHLLAFLIVCHLFSAEPLLAQPAAPTGLIAVPNYGALVIDLSWRDNSNNERGFLIVRRTDGGVFSVIGKVGVSKTTFTDANVDGFHEYTYAVFAHNQAGISGISNLSEQNLKTIWPVPASHEVLHGWNESIGEAAESAHKVNGFHNGVDIQRVGSSNAVVAPRGGIVFHAKDGPNGSVHILVDTGVGQAELDHMNHLNAGVLVTAGDVVKAGTVCGMIDQSGIFDGVKFVDHTHFNQQDPILGPALQQHPLLIFSEFADLDPNETSPALTDHAGSPPGTVLFKRQGGTYLPFDETHPLSGDIDVIVEIVDTMGTNPETTPVKLGYWIDPVPSPSCTLASGVGTPFKPYRLFDYTLAWFGANEVNLDLAKRVSDYGQNYGPNIKSGAEQYGWEHYYHFIVTNTKGTTGAVTDVDDTQFWNTNAKDDGSLFSVAHANFAGKPDTLLASEARFPDGQYEIHFVASDLLHDVDQSQTVRLENYAPFVCFATSTGELPEGTTSTTCFVSFSEAMDVATDPASVVEVDNGGIIGSAMWVGDQTLTFDVLGLVGGTTYTVSVGHGMTDLPGTPGGNELDGDQDGVGGDDFILVLSTPPETVPTVAADLCSITFNSDTPTVADVNNEECSPHVVGIPTLAAPTGIDAGSGSCSVSDSPKSIVISGNAKAIKPIGFELITAEVIANYNHVQTWYFDTKELPPGTPVVVNFNVLGTATMVGSLVQGVGLYAEDSYAITVQGAGWTNMSAHKILPPHGFFEQNQKVIPSEGSILLINGSGVEIESYINVRAFVHAEKFLQLATAGVTVSCKWEGVTSATTQDGSPIGKFTLTDGCGVDWAVP